MLFDLHRNRTLRVYDAAWVFGIARASSSPSTAPLPRQTTAALVLRAADDRVALLVDDVESLASLDPDTFRPPPHGTDPDGLLDGVCLPVTGIRALIGVANSAAIIARASLVAAS